MFTRLTHAAIAFAVTVVVYQIYALLAVPLLEPPTNLIDSALVSSVLGEDEVPAPIHKYRDLLSAYFPADHWALAQPPISYDTGQAMIILSRYSPPENGRMRIERLALLFFPHERIPGETPPRDAIVLEAPHGAELQFDSGFRTGLTGMGRIQWARLVGEVVIRSDMRDPGPEDDLLLRTRDLYMNQDLILTEADVDLQLGAHRGHGKELEMRLVPIEQGKDAAAGLNIGGIDSLEIKQEVTAQIAIEDTTLRGNPTSNKKLPPIQVTSQGRFRYEFSTHVASFIDHVQLAQTFADGKLNQLRCEALNLFFAGPEATVAPVAANAENSTVAARTRNVMDLRPGSIEAKGTDLNPVVFTAQTHSAKAECDSIWIDMQSKSVSFRASDEVQLVFQGSEMRAPLILYTMPDESRGEKVGQLKATGNGFIKAVPRGNNGPQQTFEVNWSDSMELIRKKGKPVLTLHGRPRIGMAGGRLWADEMAVVLRERGEHEMDLNLLPADIAPERMQADGHVDIRSAELNGKINHLKIDVQYLPSDLMLGNPGQSDGSAGHSLLAGGAAGGRSYNIDGDTLDVGIVVRDGKSQISTLDVAGQLEFREQALPGRTAEPLIVRGERLSVRNADTDSADISLIGSPASITAAGVSLQTVEIQVNRGTRRAELDSPGELQVPIERDFAGNLLAEPQTLNITWQGGMKLENDRVTFQGDVVARAADAQLHTERLVAVLSSSVSFDGTTQLEQAKLAQLECWEGVEAQISQRDSFGLTALHRLKLESIKANQITGLLEGRGPGWIDSHHLAASGDDPGPFPDVLPHTQLAAAKVASGGQHLRYLHIDYDTGVEGNLLQKRVAAVGNVHAVYGPVDSWDQRLPVRIDGTPAPETLYIECQRLQVAESPNARLHAKADGPAVELLAERSVVLEGISGKQGLFTARGHAASYDHLKSTFTLRWDGIHPATFTRQRFFGAPFDTQQFQIVTYNHKTDELKITGLGTGKFLLAPEQ